MLEERAAREELPELKLAGLSIGENPIALEDEILLSNIILKSQILKTLREELSGSELLRRLSEIYLETKLKTLYVLAIDTENNRARILIRDGIITGLRIELREGVVASGAEALKKLKEVSKKEYGESLLTQYLRNRFSKFSQSSRPPQICLNMLSPILFTFLGS